MIILDPNQDVVLERYNQPLDRWIIDGDDKLERLQILQRQINAGCSVPTFTCRDQNGRRYVTSCDNVYHTGFDTKAKAWKHHHDELDGGCIALAAEIKEKQEELEALFRRRDLIRDLLMKLSTTAK